MAHRGIKFAGGDINSIHDEKWSKPFRFVQMADSQYGMREEYGFSKDFTDEIAFSETAINFINSTKPLFCVICGDLVNAPPSKQEDTENPLNKEQIQVFVNTWAKLDSKIPLVCTCGNHDLDNVPNSITLNKYRAKFGADYYAFWAGGCRFIVLNSTLAISNAECEYESKQQLEWLDKEVIYLQTVKPQHTIVFMHHSLFLEDPNEEDKYYCETSPINFPMRFRIEYLERFHAANVRAVFSGHYHRNAYGKSKEMEMVTTSALCLPLGPQNCVCL